MTWRRRQCSACKRTVTTEERPQPTSIFVKKRNGKRQRFIYEKLFISLFVALDGRKNRDNGDNALLAKQMAESIVVQLFSDPEIKGEVRTDQLILFSYELLKEYEPAYADRYIYYSDYRRVVVDHLINPPLTKSKKYR